MKEYKQPFTVLCMLDLPTVPSRVLCSVRTSPVSHRSRGGRKRAGQRRDRDGEHRLKEPADYLVAVRRQHNVCKGACFYSYKCEVVIDAQKKKNKHINFKSFGLVNSE